MELGAFYLVCYLHKTNCFGANTFMKGDLDLDT
jgi:hypothetical protein